MFNWISVIRLPDFITRKDFDGAAETAARKKKVALMDEYLAQNGWANNISTSRLHHEIYMSDARKTAPEKWKTVIRHPIKKMRWSCRTKSLVRSSFSMKKITARPRKYPAVGVKLMYDQTH